MNIDSIINMFDSLIDAGLDEGTMGWSNRCHNVLPDEIRTLCEDDSMFELLMERMRPLVRDTLVKCLKEAEKNVVEAEICRRNVEENERLAQLTKVKNSK